MCVSVYLCDDVCVQMGVVVMHVCTLALCDVNELVNVQNSFSDDICRRSYALKNRKWELC